METRLVHSVFSALVNCSQEHTALGQGSSGNFHCQDASLTDFCQAHNLYYIIHTASFKAMHTTLCYINLMSI